MTPEQGILKNEESVVFSLRALYQKYGYARYKMSKFEEYDLYARNKDFLISDNIITFTDTDGRLMALKPDVTLSIVRNSRDNGNSVQKVYYNENVYRISRQSHMFREIPQAGVECIGAVDDYCIAEVVMLAAESLKQISEESVLDLSHLGILSGLLDEIAFPEEGRRQILACIAEKNLHETAAVCASSGVSPEGTERLKALIRTSGAPGEVLQRLRELQCDALAVEQLEMLVRLLEANGCGDRICIDFSALGDINYYNGIVFRGYVNGVSDSVISGGQYDKLMQKMGRKNRAVGFAVYLDQLERLSKSDRTYDVDTVLLYDDAADPLRLNAAVRQLMSSGVSVMAQKAVPEKLRYRQLAKLTESGVTILEAHA